MKLSINKNDAPIGVFDSGIGGLTVVKEIMKQLPNENLVYFGDTARVPYGSKTPDTIIRYSQQIVRFLQTKNVKAIVIACNTVSALALEILREEVEIPVIGVVIPGARSAVRTTRNKKIGVIGTEATIRSEMYTKKMQMEDAEVEVVGKACPLFVPLIEEGFANHSIMRDVIDLYLHDMRETNIDTLILGCTHYPLVSQSIQEYMGNRIQIVNPAYETAKELEQLLKHRQMEAKPLSKDETPCYSFYSSDAPLKFKNFANAILPGNVDWIEHISMEEY